MSDISIQTGVEFLTSLRAASRAADEKWNAIVPVPVCEDCGKSRFDRTILICRECWDNQIEPPWVAAREALNQ